MLVMVEGGMGIIHLALQSAFYTMVISPDSPSNQPQNSDHQWKEV